MIQGYCIWLPHSHHPTASWPVANLRCKERSSPPSALEKKSPSFVRIFKERMISMLLSVKSGVIPVLGSKEKIQREIRLDHLFRICNDKWSRCLVVLLVQVKLFSQAQSLLTVRISKPRPNCRMPLLDRDPSFMCLLHYAGSPDC